MGHLANGSRVVICRRVAFTVSIAFIGRPYRAIARLPSPRAKALGYNVRPFHGQKPGRSNRRSRTTNHDSTPFKLARGGTSYFSPFTFHLSLLTFHMWIEITADCSFEFCASNPIVSDGLEILTFGTRLFRPGCKKLKIVHLHRIVILETLVEHPAFVR